MRLYGLIASSWLLGVVFLPSLPSISHVSVFDDRRLVLVLLFAVSGTVYLFARASKTFGSSDSTRVIGFVLSAFLMLGLLSAFRAPVLGYALLEWSMFLLVFISVWILRCSPASAFRSGLLYASALSAFLYSLMVLLRVFFAHSEGQALPLNTHLINHFINIRYFNQWLSWLLPLLPAAAYLLVPRCRPIFWRLAVFAALAFLWGLLFHSGGRGTLFALTGAGLVLFLVFGWRARAWLIWQLGAALVGAALAVGTMGASWPWEVGVGLQANVWSFHDAGRLPLWTASMALIADHPWFGIGPMQYAALQFGAMAHPHSFPLQIAVEWGLTAALLLFSLLAWLGWCWVMFVRGRVKNDATPEQERAFLVGLTGSLLTAGAHSLVSGVVVTPMSLAMLVVVVGAALGQYRAGRAGGEERSRVSPIDRGLNLATRTVVLSVSIWAAGFTLIEVSNHKYNWDVGGEMAWGGYQPRFWHQGKLVHHLDEPWLAFSRDGRPLPTETEPAPKSPLPQGTRE